MQALFLSISRKTIIKKTRITETRIAAWDGYFGPSYWGDSEIISHDSQSTSFWFSLRGMVPSDRHSCMDSSCRDISDLGCARQR